MSDAVDGHGLQTQTAATSRNPLNMSSTVAASGRLPISGGSPANETAGLPPASRVMVAVDTNVALGPRLVRPMSRPNGLFCERAL